MHLVVIGFSTGVFLSIINLVPGGLGIMEGSMAAVFSAFGVPLETAVVATVIFRASYYVLAPRADVAVLAADARRRTPRAAPARVAGEPSAR